MDPEEETQDELQIVQHMVCVSSKHVSFGPEATQCSLASE